MKFTLSWLKEHLKTDASLDQITEALTDLGLEVEEVVDPADTLGAFRIARVIEAGRHPDADRLSVCRVETWPDGPDGSSQEVQVVCGAPNAKTGLVGVFAPVGTHVPGTGLDLKAGVIRGVESNGMLCSERELEVSDEHDGIIELPADAPLGARYIDYADINDPMIEIAITPNRPDALGVQGIARDLAARGLGTMITPEVKAVPGTFPCPVSVTIDQNTVQKGCPVFAGRVIRGVRNGPSPDWLQRRLRAIGLRPISALVDVTNFITYDRNRPLHVFDANKIKGNALRVHFAKGGETLTALDDKDYLFQPGMMVISDDGGPESIAGVMGGLASGCTDDTTDVFVESAYWDPIMTASTGRQLKINSDARYRFERGVDPAFTITGAEMATRMILDLCGGEPSEIVVAGVVPDTTRAFGFDPARVVSLVGMEIPEAEQRRILGDLGFDLSTNSASPPSWRPDVLGEADIVEEVARVASLTKLKGIPLPRQSAGVPTPVQTQSQRRASIARRRMAALGYNECVTYSFISEAEAALFGNSDKDRALENPISSEMSHMRPDLLPGLLAAAARNQSRGFADLALFEVGQIFSGSEPGEEKLLATGVLVGHSAPRSPHEKRRGVDLFDARADAAAVLSGLGAPDALKVMTGAPDWFHPGRSGALTLGPKNRLAVFGEVHPKVLAQMDLTGPAVAFTVDLGSLPPKKRKSTAKPALSTSDFQTVERDFAFVIPKDMPAAKVSDAAVGADKKLISEVVLFDVFEGGNLAEDQKSVAIAVRLEPKEATLKDADIEAVVQKIVAAVEKSTGGTLRG